MSSKQYKITMYAKKQENENHLQENSRQKLIQDNPDIGFNSLKQHIYSHIMYI